jgi:hypothetical protein
MTRKKYRGSNEKVETKSKKCKSRNGRERNGEREVKWKKPNGSKEEMTRERNKKEY